jgi:hypothetical protein
MARRDLASERHPAMTTEKPVTMMCIYRPLPGKEADLQKLVQAHWPVIHKAGLATDEPAVVYKAIDKHTKQPYFVEIFSWKSENSGRLAHEMPEVMKIWEPMERVMTSKTGPEIAIVERIGG